MADHGRSIWPTALRSSSGSSIIKMDFSRFESTGSVQLCTCAILYTCDMFAHYPWRLWAAWFDLPSRLGTPQAVGRGRLLSEASGVAGAHDTPSQHVSIHVTTCALIIVTFVGPVKVNVPNLSHVCVNVSF